MSAPAEREQDVVYPDSNGAPLSDNTWQLDAIFLLFSNIQALFADRDDVFVAGDLLWYPVQGSSRTNIAPDVMVAFGRPPGGRGSYKQWEEGGIAPQVVFEVWSPGNSANEIQRKHKFYTDYGVEEYYTYDPDSRTFEAWMRRGNHLYAVPDLATFVSPRLGVRFAVDANGLVVIRHDGSRFETNRELRAAWLADRQRAEEALRLAEERRLAAEQADRRAEQADRRAEEQRLAAERAAHERDEAARRAAEADRRLAEMLALLRQHGIAPPAGTS